MDKPVTAEYKFGKAVVRAHGEPDMDNFKKANRSIHEKSTGRALTTGYRSNHDRKRQEADKEAVASGLRRSRNGALPALNRLEDDDEQRKNGPGDQG